MFDEVSFDDIDVVVPAPLPAGDPIAALEAAAARTQAPSHNTKAFVRFHRPGEEGFSIVAGAYDDVGARHDSHFISGDAWMSTECHCIQCETLRVMSRYSALCAQSTSPPLMVLIDLDNFGFNQFKSIPPFADVELLDHVVVWAFFGSCFTRHHRKWPTEQTVCEPLPNRAAPVPGGPVKRSIWEVLVGKKQVYFTPCGGQSQAADNVMHRVLQALQGIETVFLTGDVKLIEEIYRNRHLLGMKSRRHNEDDMSDRLTVINVDDMDKRFVPVWRALCHRIRATLRGTTTGSNGSSSDSEEGRLRS